MISIRFLYYYYIFYTVLNILNLFFSIYLFCVRKISMGFSQAIRYSHVTELFSIPPSLPPFDMLCSQAWHPKHAFIVLNIAANVADTKFITAMNIFGLPISDGRLVDKLCCLPRFDHPITKDLRDQTWHQKGFGRFAGTLQRR